MLFQSNRLAPGAARRPPARTADILADILIEHGVDLVFGLPGGAIATINDALLDRPSVRTITTKHEDGAVFAACGYARATGRLGVAMVTSGPGFTNSVSGLTAAHAEGLPVLLIIGEAPRRNFGKGALQDGSSYGFNVVEMLGHVSKLALQIYDPNVAPSLLIRAITTALSGRQGPVVVTIPSDVSNAMIEAPDIAVDVTTSFTVKSSAISRTTQALVEARRPLIFAGSGVRRGAAAERLVQLAERLQVPVMTTPKGKGVFPDNHPLALGVFGIGGHPSATEYLQGGIDVLLAVGTSLGELSTDNWTSALRPSRELIHVDIEASQIGRVYLPTLGIVAPAEQFLACVTALAPESRRERTAGVRRHTDARTVLEGTNGLIAPQRALWELQRSLPPDTIYTVDSGEHFLFAVHYLDIRRSDAFVAMSGFGAMGSGICSALGIQAALPDRRVVAICGDGGFAMVAHEVATAAAEKLPVLFVVLNDERLGMVELGHNTIFGRTPQYRTGPLDIPRLAESLGARSMIVTHANELLDQLLVEPPRDVPTVIDVRIDRSIRMPPNSRVTNIGKDAERRKTEPLASGRKVYN